MAVHLLTVAALLMVTGTVVIVVCCWPAISYRSRARRAVVPAPVRPAPKRRDDYTLAH